MQSEKALRGGALDLPKSRPRTKTTSAKERGRKRKISFSLSFAEAFSFGLLFFVGFITGETLASPRGPEKYIEMLVNSAGI